MKPESFDSSFILYGTFFTAPVFDLSENYESSTSTSQWPFRFPLARRRYPFSCRSVILRLIVRSDLPTATASSFCVIAGFAFTAFSTASSSKVQSKVPFWHFEPVLRSYTPHGDSDSSIHAACRGAGFQKTIRDTRSWSECLFADC